MIPITISVTEEDIANGRRKRCQKCPVAIAMLRAGFYTVWANPGDLTWIDSERNEHSCVTPDEVREFITRFDNHEPVAPFTFELRDESV